MYYGWALVWALGITATVSYGILLYSFTVFVEPMERELGWSKAAITGAFSIAQLVAGLAAIPVGRWVDEHGARGLMTAGSLLVAAMLVLWSQVATLWSFYAIWCALGVAMAAVLYEPAFVVVATWFRQRRSRALTLLTFLGGFASVIFVPLSAHWVVRYGWRVALLGLAGLVVLFTVTLHAFVLRRRPSDVGARPDGDGPPLVHRRTDDALHDGVPDGVPASVALRSPAFRWLSVAFALSGLISTALSVHLVPLLIERGFSTTYAGSVMGVIGLMALPGRLLFTPLSERWSLASVTSAIFALQVVAIVALLVSRGTISLWIFAATFGAGFGAITPARAALVAHRFGAQHYGRISGVLAFAVSLARAGAPVGASLLYLAVGAERGYDSLLLLFALLSAAAAVAVMVAARDR